MTPVRRAFAAIERGEEPDPADARAAGHALRELVRDYAFPAYRAAGMPVWRV